MHDHLVRFCLLLMLPVVQTLAAPTPDPSLTVYADGGAAQWDQGYPVGNGRIGLLTLGAHPRENLYLNEHSIWARQEVAYPSDAAATL